jgi:hypothetical protein
MYRDLSQMKRQVQRGYSQNLTWLVLKEKDRVKQVFSTYPKIEVQSKAGISKCIMTCLKWRGKYKEDILKT